MNPPECQVCPALYGMVYFSGTVLEQPFGQMRSELRPHPIWLFVIVVVSLLLMWITSVNRTSDRLISVWRPEPLVSQPDQVNHLPNPPAPVLSGQAQPVAFQLDLSIDDGLYEAQRAQVISDAETALAYVIQRFGSGPNARFRASIVNDPSCGLRGIAYTDIRHVQVFSCANLSSDRAISILAHEYVHQLQQDRYGPQHLSADLILSEGLATWAAGSYWLGSHPDFSSFVREQRANGLFYPLATHYNGLGTAGMNALYYQWASFVDFLISTYGREKFDQLYVSGGGSPGAANYAGVYGKPLDALEAEWIAWLGR
jgi:hypothetical protein